MVLVTGLDHVQLAMPKGGEAEARAFFCDVLGMDEDAKPVALQARGGVWFRSGMAAVHLGVEASFAPARKAHPALVVGDIAEAEERLRASGCPVRAAEALPGMRRFYTEDPFGNRIEILAREMS